MSETNLYYVADPMCSWCWGFASVLAELEPEIRPDVPVRLVLGGLAPDDDRPMPEDMRLYVQSAWRAVEARSGARFDHDFWRENQPRRSTWPACRAVLAAGERGREMFAAIQRAYYTERRDPSDLAVLVAIAGELGLDESVFEAALGTPELQERLEQDFVLRDQLGVNGYPSLALTRGADNRLLSRGWVDAATLRDALEGEGLLANA